MPYNIRSKWILAKCLYLEIFILLGCTSETGRFEVDNKSYQGITITDILALLITLLVTEPIILTNPFLVDFVIIIIS